jgi:hypothetical protein
MLKNSRRLQCFWPFSVNGRHLSVNDPKKQVGLESLQFAVGNSSWQLKNGQLALGRLKPSIANCPLQTAYSLPGAINFKAVFF